MTPELLTEQELAILTKGLADTVIISHPEIAVTAKLLAAYEALVQQVAELEKNVADLSADYGDLLLQSNAYETALATEKAAREAAERKANAWGSDECEDGLTWCEQVNRLRAKLETARALFDRCERTLSDELLDDIDTWLEQKP